MNRGQYDSLRKHIQQLEFKLKDMLDDPRHGDARRFQDDLRKVEDALQTHANPRSIESQCRNLEQRFKSYGNTSVISQQDLNFLEDQMRSASQNLRKFDNY